VSHPYPQGGDGSAADEQVAHDEAPVSEVGADEGVITTGDIVIDAALRDLTAADPSDLDAQIEQAEALQRTLQGRLADLGE
jgi:hypothetical protein